MTSPIDIKIEVSNSLKADEWMLVSPGAFTRTHFVGGYCPACGGVGTALTFAPAQGGVKADYMYCLQCGGTGHYTENRIDPRRVVVTRPSPT